MYCTNKTHAVVDSTVMSLSLYAAKDTGNVTGVCTLDGVDANTPVFQWSCQYHHRHA